MPSRSLVHCGEKQAKNFKKSKDRVTLLACANATGNFKLPLTFIHKSTKPRCFKSIDMSKLPVHYFPQSKAWMNANIFEKWFHSYFVPYVKDYCSQAGIESKGLLLIDNAPSHPTLEKLKSSDGKFITIFLPPNTTSLIQPMDQGILEGLKRRYKKRLLQHLIIGNESSSLPIPEIVKRLTIKDAVFWSAEAWDEAAVTSLSNGWNKLLIDNSGSSLASTTLTLEDPSSSLVTATATPSNSAQATEVEDFDTLFSELGFNAASQDWLHLDEWLALNKSDPGYQLLGDEEIVATALEEDDQFEEDPYEDSTVAEVSPAQAYNAFETALTWLEAQGDVAPEHLLLVWKWRNCAAVKRTQSLKQTKLSSYCNTRT